MSFMDNIKKELTASAVSITENGAIGYATQGSALVDINFKVASLRTNGLVDHSTNDIITEFKKAYNENPELAVKWLFYIRDVRGGLGEKNTFHVIFKWLFNNGNVKHLIPYIPNFGSWKDLFVIFNPDEADSIIDLIKEQLIKDEEKADNNNTVSLLGKWMPSENATSLRSKQYARFLAQKLGLSQRNYRKLLSKLRTRLDIIETKASKSQWSSIIYEKVPSKANLLYKQAFHRHDGMRFSRFLEKVENFETTINAGTLYPHDIVSKYGENINDTSEDKALEALWKALPNNAIENTLVVADGSGSMTNSIHGCPHTSALDVANAISIYFSEHNKGDFANKYITFSNTPQFVEFNANDSLYKKIGIARRHNEVSNTDIEAVFRLVLDTAVKNHTSQEDMPKNILIISDMEMDQGTEGEVDSALFENIKRKWSAAGYKVPRLIFWNVNSRTNTIPLQENDSGLALISGFSVNLTKMIMSNKLDPFEALKEVLLSDRYKKISLKEGERKENGYLTKLAI